MHLARAGGAVRANSSRERLTKGSIARIERIVGLTELGVIEQVVDLEAELQLEFLSEGCVFQSGDVDVPESWAIEAILTGIGLSVEGSGFETGGIGPSVGLSVPGG